LKEGDTDIALQIDPGSQSVENSGLWDFGKGRMGRRDRRRDLLERSEGACDRNAQ
jgi:hypothetical protein